MEGDRSVQLVISNVDPEAAAEVRVKVYDPDGKSVLDLFDSDLRFEIPALGSRILRSAGSAAIRRGWIEVEADKATFNRSWSRLLRWRHRPHFRDPPVNMRSADAAEPATICSP